jgi:hypothetical protein
MKVSYPADPFWITRGPPGVRGPQVGKHCLRWICYLRFYFYHEYRDNKFLRNVGDHLIGSRFHSTKDHNLSSHCCENLKSNKSCLIVRYVLTKHVYKLRKSHFQHIWSNVVPVLNLLSTTPWRHTGKCRCNYIVLDVDTRWRWVVRLTPRPLYPGEHSPRYPLDRSLGGPQTWSGRCG